MNRAFRQGKANLSLAEVIVPPILRSLFLPCRLTATETVEGGLEWTLPSETTKILHPYKITWVVRVGKGAPSGTIIPIVVYVGNEWDTRLQVLVK